MLTFKGVLKIETSTKEIVDITFDNEELYIKTVKPIVLLIKDEYWDSFIEIEGCFYGKEFLKGCSISYQSWK